MRRLYFVFAALLALSGAARADSPTLIVAADGSGQYRTVQDAVDAVPAGNRERVVIHIRPGIYKGHVVVGRDKPFVTFEGDSAAQTERTVLTLDRHALALDETGKAWGTGRTGSVFIQADDFVARNLTIANSAGHGPGVGQCVALHVTGDRCVFDHCRFLSWQDTLYAGQGRHLYRDCTIEGHVDFIFGHATAVFDHCRIVSKAPGYITAQARTDATQTNGYVFRDCQLTAGAGVPDGTVYLGRPWRPFARVVYINCEMGKQIRPAGWDNWRNPANEKTALFAEVDCRGPGADKSHRVGWETMLAKADLDALDTARFLSGADNWKPDKEAAAPAPKP